MHRRRVEWYYPNTEDLEDLHVEGEIRLVERCVHRVSEACDLVWNRSKILYQCCAHPCRYADS